MSTNTILSRIRGLLPDVRAVLAFVHGLPEPLDPVVCDYVSSHVGFWRFEVASALDVGALREHQEDGVMVCPEGRMFVVFDGMGGQSSGMVATQHLLDCLGRDFPCEQVLGDDVGHEALCPLARSMRAANTSMWSLQTTGSHCRGAGATGAGVWVDQRCMNVAHAGDCRVYLWRRGELRALTRDHGLLEEYERILNGEGLSPEEVQWAAKIDRAQLMERMEQYRNIVTRAFGMMETLELGWSRVSLCAGDLVLLCTDGLHKTLDDGVMARILSGLRSDSVENISTCLMDAALDMEARDNVGLVLVRVKG